MWAHQLEVAVQRYGFLFSKLHINTMALKTGKFTPEITLPTFTWWTWKSIHAALLDTSFLWSRVCSYCHPRLEQFKLGKIQNDLQNKKWMKKLFYENGLKELSTFSQAESWEGHSCTFWMNQGGKTKGARRVIAPRKIELAGEQIIKTDHKEHKVRN